MSIEAMKQALDALERGRPQIIGVLVQQDQDAAITALRQAIAEAEKQEPDDDIYDIWVEQGTSQENRQVAKSEHDIWIAAACLKSTVESAIKAGDWKVDGACDPTRDLAYLADCLANSRHEWVGLTHEERDEIDQYCRSHMEALFAIEAKLREKNT